MIFTQIIYLAILIFHANNAEESSSSSSTIITPATSPNPPLPPLPPMAPAPPQQKCLELKAFPSTEINPAYQVTKWVVGRITVLKEHGSLDINTNICSAYSYVENCGALHFYWDVSKTSEITRIVDTYAYYSKTDTLVHYKEIFILDELYYDIWAGKVISMESIANDQKSTEVNPIPGPVLETHEKTFAAVAVDKDGKYIVFRLCGTEIVWVAFPKDDLGDDPKACMAKYEADIDKHITDMQLDPKNVVAIDTDFKIPLPPSHSVVVTTNTSGGGQAGAEVNGTPIPPTDGKPVTVPVPP